MFQLHFIVRERLAPGGSQQCYGHLNRAPRTSLALPDVPLDVAGCLGVPRGLHPPWRIR
jgi:hypothetical protein